MSGPSGAASPPPPPPPPPPDSSSWSPPAAPTAPAKPLSERFNPEAMGSRMSWKFLAFFSQGLGLLLLFIGTLVMIIFGGTPINCIGAASCSQSTLQGIAYGVVVARSLWAIGLLGLAAGTGMHLQFTAPPAEPTTPERVRIYLARRRGEFGILVLSIILLFALLVTSPFVFGAPL